MAEWRRSTFAAVRAVLGLLLLAAASLKIYGLSVSTVPPVGWFSAPAVQAAAIGWEILLGLWLLSGAMPAGSWLATVVTFTLLAGISGYLGWIGQAKCGCFGTIEASPWHAFAADVAALVLLAVGPPNWQPIQTVPRGAWWQVVSSAAYFVLGVGVIFACFAGIGAWVYGSPAAALARLRGESLTVSHGYIDCGTGKPGETLEGTVEVRNWTDRPVRLYGGTSDCSCVATIGLPVTIPPGEGRVIPLWLKVPESAPGTFTRDVRLITDYKQQKTIRLCIGCQVE